MERLITQEKHGKIKEAKFLRKKGKMKSTAKLKVFACERIRDISKTEFGIGEVAKG